MRYCYWDTETRFFRLCIPKLPPVVSHVRDRTGRLDLRRIPESHRRDDLSRGLTKTPEQSRGEGVPIDGEVDRLAYTDVAKQRIGDVEADIDHLVARDLFDFEALAGAQRVDQRGRKDCHHVKLTGRQRGRARCLRRNRLEDQRLDLGARPPNSRRRRQVLHGRPSPSARRGMGRSDWRQREPRGTDLLEGLF